MNQHLNAATRKVAGNQAGASLIMVMIILTIVSMLGVAAIQISIMGERSARNDRDYQVAWQSAEAGLLDAETDISAIGSARSSVFTPNLNTSAFISGCGSSGNSRGLCTLVTPDAPVGTSTKTAWLLADLAGTTSTVTSAEYGQFTGRTFPTGTAGFQPSQRPRYVIELVPDNSGRDAVGRDLTNPEPQFVFRITSMGFGPRPDIQAVVQAIYRN